MAKKTGLYICFAVFLFQAVLFNFFLCGSLISAKLDETGFVNKISLTKKTFDNLKWQDETEFIFGNYLVDVKNVEYEKNIVTLQCKIDLKEKYLLEALSEYFKRSKNKKLTFFSFNVILKEPFQLKTLPSEKIIYFKDAEPGLTILPSEKTSPPPKA